MYILRIAEIYARDWHNAREVIHVESIGGWYLTAPDIKTIYGGE